MGQQPFFAGIKTLAGKINPYFQGSVQGDAWVSQYHGTKYTQAYKGSLFFCANQSGVTLSAGLATTYVGICISNPKANTNNLSLRSVSGIVSVAPAALLGLGLIVGYNATTDVTHTTALTPQPAKFGTGPAATAKVDSAATLPTAPVWAEFLAETVASAGQTSFNKDFEGGFLLPPGAYAAIGALVAGPASGFLGSIQWTEQPV